jgi:predicted Ser/Thr protein kinase
MNETSQLWSRCLKVLQIESAFLLYQSVHDPFRRTYALQDKIYKIVVCQKEISSHLRHQDMSGEFDIMKRCAGIRGIPLATDFIRSQEYEALVVRRLSGKPMSSLSIHWTQLLIVLAKLSIILFKLSLRGVSHNDITPSNILVDSTGSISLIDFDQATRAGCISSLVRQFLGIGVGGDKVHSSVFTIVRRRFKNFRRNVLAKIKTLTNQLWKSNSDKHTQLPVIPAEANDRLKNMLNAWQIAQASNANSPSKKLAYYSLNFEGHFFPGERRWNDRWDILRSITDYTGKRILELGCNMALLSCYLLKESKAAAAFAVDVDADILMAAERVGLAFGVNPSLKQVNFDEAGEWENELIAFKPDIVFALSVLNWVENKERFVSFLGRFPMVIFEGHDHINVECERLCMVGFKQMDIVGISERKREIILCQK